MQFLAQRTGTCHSWWKLFFFVLVGAVNAVVDLRVLDDFIAVCDSWGKLIC